MAGLPFVGGRPADSANPYPRDFWAVEKESANHLTECERGEAFARLALDHMRKTHAPPLLGWIISDMIDKGRFSGVEIGFLRVFAVAAMRGISQ